VKKIYFAKRSSTLGEPSPETFEAAPNKKADRVSRRSASHALPSRPGALFWKNSTASLLNLEIISWRRFLNFGESDFDQARSAAVVVVDANLGSRKRGGGEACERIAALRGGF
jgi:hypothetical protein